MLGEQPIEGEGIRLRPFSLDDVPMVTAACQDKEIVRWTASIPSPYEEEHARSWIELHDGWRRDGTNYPFAIVEADDRVLGCINVEPGTMPGAAAVGYWMAAWARGRGVATRALVALSEWAFASLHVDRLDLVTLLGNVASERVAQKSGFVLAAELDDYVHPARPGETFRAKWWVRAVPRV